MRILLIIESYALSADRDALNLAYDYHYFWQGEAHRHIYLGYMDKIWSRGRVPKTESIWLLNEIASLGKDVQLLGIVDAGKALGWMKAVWHGIWRYPAMVVDGRKVQGRQACEKVLKGLK